jgi:hypothetical protein
MELVRGRAAHCGSRRLVTEPFLVKCTRLATSLDCEAVAEGSVTLTSDPVPRPSFAEMRSQRRVRYRSERSLYPVLTSIIRGGVGTRLPVLFFDGKKCTSVPLGSLSVIWLLQTLVRT